MATSTRFRSPILVGKNNQKGNVMLTQVSIWDYAVSALTTGVAGVPAITLPKGAMIEHILVDTNDISGGSTPTFILGTAADPNGILVTEGATDGLVHYYRGESTVGAKWLTAGGPLAADSPILMAEDTGTEATAGTHRVVIEYFLDPDFVIDASGE